MIRVALCDDHELVRRGLALLLGQAGDICVGIEAENAGSLQRQLRETPCDVLVMDIEMPGRNGGHAIAQLRRQMPKMAALVLSSHPESQFAVRALRAGAAGYLHKAAAPQQLVAAVRQVASGRRFISPQVSEALAASVAGGQTDNPHESLSDREFEVFRQIASGRKLSEIARALSLSPKTVSVYRSRMLEKLGLSGNVDIARYALRHVLLAHLPQAQAGNPHSR